MVMIAVISFQLQNGCIQCHVSVDVSKCSRQNPSHIQKQDNYMCAVPGLTDPADSRLAYKEVLSVSAMHSTALQVLQPNGISVNLRHS